eukprot:4436080-Pyramimonas_sp.AAC.1
MLLCPRAVGEYAQEAAALRMAHSAHLDRRTKKTSQLSSGRTHPSTRIPSPRTMEYVLGLLLSTSIVSTVASWSRRA